MTLTVAAQTGRQLKVYMKGGLVDKVQVATDASISHSRTDLNGTVHDDYVSMVFKDAEGRERQYLISQLDSLVMPNGRRVVFLGSMVSQPVCCRTADDFVEHPRRAPHRSSFSGRFPGVGTGNVTFKWTENDRIRLDVGYESRAEQLSADGTSASFVFDEADDLQAEHYMVYFPDRRVTIKSVQTQTGANNSLHIYDSGDCGTAIATRNGNDNGNGNENDNENDNENAQNPSSNTQHPSPTTYTFTLEHKAAYLCFLPHIDNLPSAKLTKITLSCSAAIAGIYQLSGNGLYNGTATSSTITLNLVPQKNIDFFIGHDALTEQDSCAAYMVIAPQGSSQTFTATYYITDTLSHISKVYRQTFSLKPEANTVYPVTCHILDEEFRTIDLGLSCNWSNVNVGAREPSKAGSTFDSDAKANAALLEQTVVTQWLMPDEDQREEILEKCRWTFGIYNAQTGYFVEGAAIAKEYGEKLRIFLPCSTSLTKEQCLRQNYRPVEVLMVDLGLSSGTKWAARNLGATSVEDYGHYYAWGEVETKDSYTQSNYKYGTQNLGNNYDISGTQNDAAVVNWGGIWRMPTYAEMKELSDSCSWTWKTINGVYGFVIEKKAGGTGNKIFLPSAGYMNGTSLDNTVKGGSYWTSVQSYDRNWYAWTLSWQIDYHSDKRRCLYGSSNYDPFWGDGRATVRYFGRPVRAVAAPNAVAPDGTMLNVVTDSVTWKLGQTTAVLYGSLSSTTPIKGTVKVGFVVGDSANIVLGKSRFEYEQEVSVAGSFSQEQSVYDNIGYWYRAYINTGDTVFYGQARHYGYEMVDLGLPSGVKWANMNVGADAPEDYGIFYAWGEVTPKESYTQANYLYNNQNLGEALNIAGSDNDAAHVNLGNAWCMPTKDDWVELNSECSWHWESQNNVNGFKITGPNGNSIFLPSSGYMSGASLDNSVNGGSYWSSLQNGNRSWYIWTLSWQVDYHSDKRRCIYGGSNYDPFWGDGRGTVRYFGRPVRAVAAKNNATPDGLLLNIHTDSCAWKLNDTSATLHGSLSSTTPITKDITVGFIIGMNDSITMKTVASENKFPQTINHAGTFSQSLPVHDNFGYYYRAYVETGDTIFYGKVCHFGIEVIDLGLPSHTLWANMNVGASTPQEYGNYYAWGETATKSDYSEVTYQHRKNGIYADLGQSWNIAGTNYDAVHVNLGNAWVMPTSTQLNELRTECSWSWTTQENVTGYKVTGPNGKSIFLPNAGFRGGTTLYYDNYYDSDAGHVGGCYMSSNQSDSKSSYIPTVSWCRGYSSNTRYFLSGNDYAPFWWDGAATVRYFGRTIRAVFVPNATNVDSTIVMNILTDSASWKLDDTSATLYGTVSSTMPIAEGTKVGFVVGDSANITLTGQDAVSVYEQPTTGYGSFSQQISIVGNMGYWYRAYVEMPNGEKYYGVARHVGWEMVDLGLDSRTLWCNMNVGSSWPEDYGNYYAWGETQPKTNYSDGAGYAYYNQSIGNNGNIQATTYDAAYVNTGMGSSWCIPTSTQWSELRDGCNWTLVTENGITGYRVSGKKEGYKNRSIFLPNAGFKGGTSWYYHNSYDNDKGHYGGSYWTANVGSNNSYAITLSWCRGYSSNTRYLLSGNDYAPYWWDGAATVRYFGRSVRAVAVQKASRP